MIHHSQIQANKNLSHNLDSHSHLILCCVIDRNNRAVKRWCKPETPIYTPCCACGFGHAVFAKDAERQECLDCYACKIKID